jgi:hypothetical protein
MGGELFLASAGECFMSTAGRDQRAEGKHF